MTTACNLDLTSRVDNQFVNCISWIVELYRLSQHSGSKFDDYLIFQKILEHIVTGFNADSGSLAFLSEDRKQLKLVAGIDLPPGVVGTTVPLSGSRMRDVVQSGKPALFNGALSKPSAATSANGPRVTSAMCWPIRGEHEGVVGALNINRGLERSEYTDQDLEAGGTLIELINIVLENTRLHRDRQSQIVELERMNTEIRGVNEKLAATQNQLLQSEKMASVGQLAAGVAHEINNPVGYINSNVGTLQQYVNELFEVLDIYLRLEQALPNEALLTEVREAKERVNLAYLREDIVDLISESQEGVSRVKQIVQDLKDFSHVDGGEWEWANLEKALESTLNVARNEVKYKADVKKEYSNIPSVECMPSQLNQVFMNLIVNAAHAMKERGVITIKTGSEDNQVWVSVSDTGTGITPEVAKRIFEPFFTTKPVGKGTGLGLSLSYGIVEKHGGRIELATEVGKGSTFTVWLPIQQKQSGAAC